MRAREKVVVSGNSGNRLTKQHLVETATVTNHKMKFDRFTVRKQWRIPWTKKLNCWLSFESGSVTFEKERFRNVRKMITILLLLLVTGVKYTGTDYKQILLDLVVKSPTSQVDKLDGYSIRSLKHHKV